MTNCSMDSLSAGEAAAKEVAEEAAVEALIGDIVKMCEEEGTRVGNEVYGEFGGSIGKEAAVTAGTKAARIKIRELIEVVAADRNTHIVGLGIKYSKETCKSGEFGPLPVKCKAFIGRRPNPRRTYPQCRPSTPNPTEQSNCQTPSMFFFWYNSQPDQTLLRQSDSA